MEDDIIEYSDADFVKVNVSNSKNDNVAFEMKYKRRLNIGQLKKKFEVITGGCAATMQLELYDGERLIKKLKDDFEILAELPIKDGMRIHVVDNFTWITNESVDKFELTEDQYEQKGDTVRDFLKKNRMGKYNDEEMREKDEKRRQQKEREEKQAELCTIGARCQVNVAGIPTRRGTIMYKGPIKGKNSTFIGIKYDEPLGKNDGSIDGEIYFKCDPKYGGFVSPLAVEVGDFPPEDAELDDEI